MSKIWKKGRGTVGDWSPLYGENFSLSGDGLHLRDPFGYLDLLGLP